MILWFYGPMVLWSIMFDCHWKHSALMLLVVGCWLSVYWWPIPFVPGNNAAMVNVALFHCIVFLNISLFSFVWLPYFFFPHSFFQFDFFSDICFPVFFLLFFLLAFLNGTQMDPKLIWIDSNGSGYISNVFGIHFFYSLFHCCCFSAFFIVVLATLLSLLNLIQFWNIKRKKNCCNWRNEKKLSNFNQFFFPNGKFNFIPKLPGWVDSSWLHLPIPFLLFFFGIGHHWSKMVMANRFLLLIRLKIFCFVSIQAKYLSNQINVEKNIQLKSNLLFQFLISFFSWLIVFHFCWN